MLFYSKQGENDIREIEGLENCPNLRRLHLRDNQILEVTGFSPKSAKLEYVNLRYRTKVRRPLLRLGPTCLEAHNGGAGPYC